MNEKLSVSATYMATYIAERRTSGAQTQVQIARSTIAWGGTTRLAKWSIRPNRLILNSLRSFWGATLPHCHFANGPRQETAFPKARVGLLNLEQAPSQKMPPPCPDKGRAVPTRNSKRTWIGSKNALSARSASAICPGLPNSLVYFHDS